MFLTEDTIILLPVYHCSTFRPSRALSGIQYGIVLNEHNYVLQNVPLSSLASIKELKAYLRLHLNLGLVTAVG